MICPHCLQAFHDDWVYLNSSDFTDSQYKWRVRYTICPECEKAILQYQFIYLGYAWSEDYATTVIAYPKSTARNPVPKEVDESYSNDYEEACLILADSPKASAALSRRCLQHILEEKAIVRDEKGKWVNIKKGNLSNEIDQVLEGASLPQALHSNLDAVREIGNFAAHPTKDTSTGEIVDVEPDEAEWNLDVIESLFDYYFVAPVKAKEKKDKLNAKLKAAGRKEIA